MTVQTTPHVGARPTGEMMADVRVPGVGANALGGLRTRKGVLGRICFLFFFNFFLSFLFSFLLIFLNFRIQI
jgi:hypothetical protein